MRPRSIIVGKRRRPSSLPTSGQLMGKFVSILRANDYLQEHTLDKTARRYFKGEPIRLSSIRRVVEEVVRDLLPEHDDVHAVATDVALNLVSRWDVLSAVCRSHAFPIEDPKQEFMPLLRMFLVDSALRWAAWRCKRRRSHKTDYEVVPGMTQESLDDLLSSLRAKAGDLTVEDLTAVVDKNTLLSWRHGRSVPKPSTIDALVSKLCASGALDKVSVTLQIRVAFGVRRAISVANEQFGAAAVAEWIEVFRKVSARGLGVLEARGDVPDHEIEDLILAGAWSAIAAAIVGDIARADGLTEGVRGDIRALPTDWRLRVEYWCEHYGHLDHVDEIADKCLSFAPNGTRVTREVAEKFVRAICEREISMIAPPPGDSSGYPYRIKLTPRVTSSAPDIASSQLRAKAEAAHWQKDYDEEYRCLSTAVEKYPDSFTSRLKLAEFYERQGYYHAWGGHKKFLGLFGLALREYRAASDLEPDLAGPWYQVGTILGNLGHYYEAQHVFELARELEPETPFPVFGLGLCAAYQRRFDEAIAHFDEALRLQPGELMVLIRKAACHMQLGQLQKAKQVNREARERGGPEIIENNEWKKVLEPPELKRLEDAELLERSEG